MVKLIRPYGFCFGVTNTLHLIEKLRKSHPQAKISLFGAPVHNEAATGRILNTARADLVIAMTPQSEENFLIFSAHGHTTAEEEQAKRNNYTAVDGICPFLRFRNLLIESYLKEGFRLYVVGDLNHRETRALVDIYDEADAISLATFVPESLNKDQKILIVFQSTVDPSLFAAFKKTMIGDKKNHVVVPICYECVKRHRTLDAISFKSTDYLLVVGDKTSANTCALYDHGVRLLQGRSGMILTVADLPDFSFPPDTTDIYVASGTSAADSDVEVVYDYLSQRYTS